MPQNTLRREKEAIGERLRLARQQAHSTPEEAAEAAGVQVTAVKAWEAGRTLPSLTQFRSLLAAYGGTGYQILFGVNPFEMTESESRELAHLVRRHGSPGLARRMDLLLTMLAHAGANQATSA